MKLQHKHGGDIVAIKSVAHETYKGVAQWFYIGDVNWRDGSKSIDTEIPPYAICFDSEDAEASKEFHWLHDRLNNYLQTAGQWHKQKTASDGRVYSWTPKEPKGKRVLK